MSRAPRRITLADISEASRPSVRSKYGSQAVVAFGEKFDSKHERDCYFERRGWLRDGRIADLRLQHKFPIVIGGVPVRYESGRQMTYRADFTYIDTATGRRVVEDAKSDGTRRKEAYRIKKALMRAMGIEIQEV